jgi:hypothetical protein
MSERGVFAVDRGIFDHPKFRDERQPLSKLEAWLWLLASAAWKPHVRRIAGKGYELKRGQLAASTRYMAERWRWSEAKVRRFLTTLKTDADGDAEIDAVTDAGITIITIRKYNQYQRVSLPGDAPTDAGDDAGTDAAATQQRRNKEDIQYKESPEADASARQPDLLDGERPVDARTDLFRRGLGTLARITGKTPDSCRSLVGQWLKLVNDEAIHVTAAIEDAERNRVADPVPWIKRHLESLGRQRGPPGAPSSLTFHQIAEQLSRPHEAPAPTRPDATHGAGDGARQLTFGPGLRR